MATISSSETFAKRRAIFLSVRKTVNGQGYSELQGANQNARKLLSTDLINTKNQYVESWAVNLRRINSIIIIIWSAVISTGSIKLLCL